MEKNFISLLWLVLIFTLFSGCTMDNKVNKEKATTENYVLVYNWGISNSKNNPKEIKKVLDIIDKVDFDKFHELESKGCEDIKFYNEFYNYPSHNIKTITNIFKAREKTYVSLSNEFDKVIFDLYKKKNVRPIITEVTKSNPKYKKLLDSIVESETNVNLVYNWKISTDRTTPNQTRKILYIVGRTDFKKLQKKLSEYNQQTKKDIEIDLYEAFYTYPYHDAKTITNIFKARENSDGGITEQFDAIIYNLYQKNDVKPIIDKVINSNPKYKDSFKSIVEFETQ